MDFLLILLAVVLAMVVVWLAYKFVGVVVVKESTATIFECMGRFSSCEMEAKNRHFEFDGNIVPGNGSLSYGSWRGIFRIVGWVFYIKPFVRPVDYNDHNDKDGFGEGIRVFLNDIQMAPFAPKAETAAPENVPLDVRFVMQARIVNPYRWLYIAPRDARAKVAERMVPVLRQWVRSGNEEHAQAGKGNGEMLWSEITATGPDKINCQGVIDQIRDEWGLEIIENGITVGDIAPDLGHQEALKAARDAELNADASVRETAGRIVKMVAETAGLTVEELKGMLKADPTLRSKPASKGGFKEAFIYAEDQTKRDRSGSGLQDVRISNGQGGPLPSGISYLSVGGGGGGVGVMANGRRGKNQDGGRQRDDRGKGNRRDKGSGGEERGENGRTDDEDLKDLDAFVEADEKNK